MASTTTTTASSSSFCCCCCSSVHRLFLLFLGQALFVSYLLHHHVELEKEYQAVQHQLLHFQQQQQQHESKNNSNKNNNALLLESSSSSRQEERRILFVHVGKTGGETVKNVLRMGCEVRRSVAQRTECWNDFDVAHESKVSQLTIGYFHYRQMKPSDAAQVATDYLFTVRHPVQRLQSWFRFVTPLNCPTAVPLLLKSSNATATTTITTTTRPMSRHVSCRNREIVLEKPDSWEARFFSCFPSIQHMAKGLTQKIDASRCSRMLRHVLNGQGGHGEDNGEAVVGHLAANFQYYHRHTVGLEEQDADAKNAQPPPPPVGREDLVLVHHSNRSILALRTESLWQDLKELDILLGGNGYFRKEGLRVSHVHHHSVEESKRTYKDPATLSPHGGKLLCCALQDELAIYRELIVRATNLNATEKTKTLSAALELCRATTWPGLVQGCGMKKSKLLESLERWPHSMND